MERITIERAKKIFGIWFLGPDEIDAIADKLGVSSTESGKYVIPEITFSEEELQQKKDTHLLILTIPFLKTSNGKISINYLRTLFGFDPDVNEPCFYNQDWYINEDFARICNLELGWHLLRKGIIEESRGKHSTNILKLPSALLLTYTFFAFWLSSGITLFANDFIWCSDQDSNGDQIYVGRYQDLNGIAKNGFSIHRFLSLTPTYGSIV